MFKFVDLLKRFIPPYKKYVVLSLLFNLLSTIFSLFSFAAIIPVLQILFKISNQGAVYQAWSWNEGFSSVKAPLKNNLFYSIDVICIIYIHFNLI